MVIDMKNFTNCIRMAFHQREYHVFIMLAITVALTGRLFPQSTVNLGTASGFAALAAAGITNSGNTVLTGDVGSYPTVNITGFPPGKFSGINRMGDITSKVAMADFTAAYNDAASRTLTAAIPEELGGITLTPGVYNSASGTLGITGTLILDARNNDSAVFIFQTATTLTLTPGSRVILINGAVCANIFWQVGSSAILGANSVLEGTILAHSSITLHNGTVVHGHLFAGAVAISGALKIDNGITLPVELAAFTAILSYKTVILKWATATEIDNYGFVVQRSQPAKNGVRDTNWTKIGFVKGMGTSNSSKYYIYTDKSITYGNYAYRLKQLDNDGHITYSGIVEVSAGQIPEELQTDLY
jgi:hypothetical protein